MDKSDYSKRQEAVIRQAKMVLRIEEEAIQTLRRKIDDNFNKSVDLLDQCIGKVIVIGIGKSGIVSQKIASTFACTGTPAFFLHPAEGIHGDIGMMSKGDVVLAISNSGETHEIIQLLPLIKRWGIKLIVITGKPNSVLARSADVVLDTGVKEEACPLGLVPTASTTAALCMGDAIAVTISRLRSFKATDFARFHPGGALSKRFSKVSDYMHKDKSIPVVNTETPMKDVIVEITRKTLGLTTVTSEDGKLVGIITDGDLRRAIEKDREFLEKPAKLFMTKNPKTINSDELALNAVSLMEKNYITALAITDEEGTIKGVLKFQDLVAGNLI